MCCRSRCLDGRLKAGGIEVLGRTAESWRCLSPRAGSHPLSLGSLFCAKGFRRSHHSWSGPIPFMRHSTLLPTLAREPDWAQLLIARPKLSTTKSRPPASPHTPRHYHNETGDDIEESASTNKRHRHVREHDYLPRDRSYLAALISRPNRTF